MDKGDSNFIKKLRRDLGLTKSTTEWDNRFLGLAQYVSPWSKDPSTQTGAVLVDVDKGIIAVGYNGFPQGIEDTPERLNNRELKYRIIRHCEENTFYYARGRDTRGSTLYTYPFLSCPNCASEVIQHKVARVVAPPLPDRLKERWEENIALTLELFDEAGIIVVQKELK